jgi:adenylate kinase family enzyme
MRVYLSGAHGSGKSTLARHISQQYKLLMLTEAARKVLSERELRLDDIRHDLDLVDDYQQEVFSRQLAEETKHTDFVSDRCILDCLAYSAQHTRILPKLLQSPELTTNIARLKQADVKLFFVRPSKLTLKADGVREQLSWEGVIAIDAMLKLLLEMFELPYFIIASESMQERTKLISSVLSSS